MGKAKIVSHDGDGLYTVIYYHDNSKVDKLLETINNELDSISDELIRVASDINSNEVKWANEKSLLDSAIASYQACLLSTENPAGCDTTAVVAYTSSTREALSALYLSEGEEQRIKIQEDRLNTEVIRLESVDPEEQSEQIWCADLCANDGNAPVGDYAYVGDVIPVDTIVGVIEIFDYTTKSYERIIEPASFDRDPSYVEQLHGISKPSLSSNAYGFVYNFELRSPSLTWVAKYKFATVTEIKSEDGILKVKYDELVDELGVSLNTNIDEARLSAEDVTIDYMNCDTVLMKGSAFDVGDEVIIRFDSPKMTDPVCIGFRNNPKRCAPPDAFIFYDDGLRNQFECLISSAGVWTCTLLAAFEHGAHYWNRGSDGAYISFGAYISTEDSTYGDGMWQTLLGTFWVNGIKYVIGGGFNDTSEIVGACLDANDDLFLFTYHHTNFTKRLIKYDWSTWTEVTISGGFLAGHWQSCITVGHHCLSSEDGSAFYFWDSLGTTKLLTTGSAESFTAEPDIPAPWLEPYRERHSLWNKQPDGTFECFEFTYSRYRKISPNLSSGGQCYAQWDYYETCSGGVHGTLPSHDWSFTMKYGENPLNNEAWVDEFESIDLEHFWSTLVQSLVCKDTFYNLMYKSKNTQITTAYASDLDIDYPDKKLEVAGLIESEWVEDTSNTSSYSISSCTSYDSSYPQESSWNTFPVVDYSNKFIQVHPTGVWATGAYPEKSTSGTNLLAELISKGWTETYGFCLGFAGGHKREDW